MKIAFITFEYPPFIIGGGAGIYAQKITRELVNLGHEVVVFTPQVIAQKHCASIAKNMQIRGVRVHHGLPFKALQFWIKLPGEIEKAEREYGKFDILHFNGISYWFFKKRIYPAPHIITIHHLVVDAIRNNNLGLISRVRDISGENSLFIPSIEKRCLHSADKIIAVSNFTKEQIIKNYKINPSKIEVVYNGIDLDGYTFPQEDLRETRKQLNLPEKPVILFVGRVDDPRKGLDLLLRAFKKVLERVEAILLVVGKGDQTEVRKLANSLGISRNVIFAGFIDDATLKKCYALCDIYVCSSRLEGFGLTVLEAMIAGKLVVATNVGAIPEIVKNGENGILVGLGDVDGMSKAICTFLHNEKLVGNIFGKNINYIEERFSWTKSAKEIERLYMQLAGGV